MIVRRGLGAVDRVPVDIWGFVTAPDNPCFTGAMRNGVCMTPAELGFDPDAAATTYYGRMPIDTTSPPHTGQRVMDVWRGGPVERYVGGTPDVWTGDAWVRPAAPKAPAPPPAPSTRVVSSNGAAGAAGGTALPGGGALLSSLTSAASAGLEQAQGLGVPMWVWLAAGLGAAALFMGGSSRGGR